MDELSNDFNFELDFKDSFDYMIGHEFIEMSKDKVITKATDIANSKGQQALDAAKQAASDLYQA